MIINDKVLCIFISTLISLIIPSIKSTRKLSIDTKNIIESNCYFTLDGYSISLKLGSPGFEICYMLSFEKDFLWTKNPYIGYGNSTSQLTLDSIYPFYMSEIHNQIRVWTVKDILRIKSENNNDNNNTENEEKMYINISNFHFYYVSPDDIYLDDELGLSYKNNDSQYNFLAQLKNLGFINKKSFSIAPSQGNHIKNDRIIFGGVSNYYLNKYKHDIITCDVDKNIGKWGCYVNSMNISGNVYNIDKYGVFSASEYYLTVPYEIIDNLSKTLFKESIEKNDCEVSDLGSIISIRCLCSAVYNFTGVKINLNGVDIEINNNYIFGSFIDECELLIKGSTKNEFIIPVKFLDKYVSYYDVEDSVVILYSNINIEKVTNNKVIEEIIYIIILVICSISCGYLYIIKRKFNSI